MLRTQPVDVERVQLETGGVNLQQTAFELLPQQGAAVDQLPRRDLGMQAIGMGQIHLGLEGQPSSLEPGADMPHMIDEGGGQQMLRHARCTHGSATRMAHHKHHLKAVCQQCGADAEYSYRMTQNHVLVLIGAENHYEPRCEKCFNINQ